MTEWRNLRRALMRPALGVLTVLVANTGLITTLALWTMPQQAHAAPLATTPILKLQVQSARSWIPAGLHQGDAIPHYHWLIVQNDVGNPSHYGTNLGANDIHNSNYACTPPGQGGDPSYPDNCQWSSIHSFKGGAGAVGGPNGAADAEIVAQGDESNLNATTGLDTTSWPQNSFNPNRSYMINVTAGGYDVAGCTKDATHTCHVDGFEVGAAYFNAPLTGSGVVTVSLQPDPLPLSTVRMKVYYDSNTNGAYDTGEQNLQGFEGHIADPNGVVTNDYWGNPICTTYQHDANGLFIYGSDGKPAIQQTGGHCYSDANGVVTIPYLQQNHFTSTVTPPNGQTWWQTSSLDGDKDWDTWAIQGWDGYDPEFIQGKENWPFAEFGFVKPLGDQTNHAPVTATPTSKGTIKGQDVAASEWVPNVGAYNLGANQGVNVVGPMAPPQIPATDPVVVGLVNLNGNDNTIYNGLANPDGSFVINNVPDGDYSVFVVDEYQIWLQESKSVSIVNGNAVDLGNIESAAWFSDVHGKVCFDTNRNGKCDPGEPGIPNLPVQLLGRDNSVQQYGDATIITDANGNYDFHRAYPWGRFVVQQGYWENYYTVGVTYQADNQPQETTEIANGGFVDLSVLNQVGHQDRIDWAIHTYETDPTYIAQGYPSTGGIVGEMVYNINRFTQDPYLTASSVNEPGISGIPVHLYAPVTCDPTQTPPAGMQCTKETTSYGSNTYLTYNPPNAAQYPGDGSLVKLSDGSTGNLTLPDGSSCAGQHYCGAPIDLNDPYMSETWQRPVNCTARQFDGSPLVQQQVLPSTTGGHGCLEAPLLGQQVGDNSQQATTGITGANLVNGNYGFTQVKVDPKTGQALSAPETIPAGDYIVAPDVPKDPITGKPVYVATKEEDLNINQGDTYFAAGESPTVTPTLAAAKVPNVPSPQIPPPPCVGPLHTVNVVSDPTQANFDPNNPSTTSGVYNPSFAAAGGSPFQGQFKSMCTSKLVTVRPGRSTTPNFYWHPNSDVPLPGRIFGLVTDDLNLSTNPKELNYGEKYGLPNIPIGIYDFDNRLVTTVYTDPNGEYDVLLPSTTTYNCPNPDSVCPNVYRFLENDPGQPGHLNPGYNPAYRTMSAMFEVFPGIDNGGDLAPLPALQSIESPGVQYTHPVACQVNDSTNTSAPLVPEFYSVDRLDLQYGDTGANRYITINGQHFGAAQGTGHVQMDGSNVPIVSWSDGQIVFRVPTGMGTGPHQVTVISGNGQKAANGVTIHVLGYGYNPTVFEVGPGKTYNSDTDEHAIQHALDAASKKARALVLVYPGTPGGGPYGGYNPLGAYYENLIIHSPVKLQGVGPGGTRADGTYVPGTVIDGVGFGTDSARDTAWQNTISSLSAVLGPGAAPINDATVALPEGEVVLVVATSATQYTSGFKAAIDGMQITGGDTSQFAPNALKLNYEYLGEGTNPQAATNTPSNPDQGGGIVALASTRYLQVTNNLIASNTGAYAGAIRMGTPTVGDNNLDGVTISHNRIIDNGGTNLAGAIGIFTGTRGYEVSYNDICGNFSAEYGGGISHYGLSGASTVTHATKSSIHDNRVYFNGSYDEGAGIIIAGEQPATATAVSPGAGAVDVYNNLLQGNLANDDGGGLRFLDAGNFAYNVYNNMIVNNVSTHEGGGVSIDNAPAVRFYNNTVMKNLTTATAQTSHGEAEPAGLSTGLNNAYFQATLPVGSPNFSNPVMFNNIFWDNRAGHWDGMNIIGIGGKVWGTGANAGQLVPDPTPINYWDIGLANGDPGTLAPTYSILEPTTNGGVPNPYASGTGNKTTDPGIITPYDLTVSALPWTGNPQLVAPVTVAVDSPVSILGNYRLASNASPAYNAGAASANGFNTLTGANITIHAPTFDFDNQPRPLHTYFDIGADELR